MKEFLHELNPDKIKINWNKNPITMELFLLFLLVKTERHKKDFLGCSNGWTKRTGEGGLVVKGGIVKGVEYLDSLKYGKNIDNPYNDFVNPFYLFDILSEAGKEFFHKYYAKDIKAILVEVLNKANHAELKKEKTFNFWKSLGVDTEEI